MTDVATLDAALVAEFGGEIVYQSEVPSTFSAPSVVVSPGDPFITNDTFGMIRETWDVLVAVSMKDRGNAVRQLRDLSLRVRRVISSVGGIWDSATGPKRLGDEDAKGMVISVNRVEFSYDPSVYTTEPDPGSS
jgi:hypothetical protein